ncbi:hypothetical protein V3G39_15555 [Dermatophilaceae bacterium Sec6.4]
MSLDAIHNRPRGVNKKTELSIVLHLGDTVRLGEVQLLVEMLVEFGTPANHNLLIRENGEPAALGLRSPLQNLTDAAPQANS